MHGLCKPNPIYWILCKIMNFNLELVQFQNSWKSRGHAIFSLFFFEDEFQRVPKVRAKFGKHIHFPRCHICPTKRVSWLNQNWKKYAFAKIKILKSQHLPLPPILANEDTVWVKVWNFFKSYLSYQLYPFTTSYLNFYF